ncbi:MAG: MgtC/SapB family protein [Burkholderiales bacterium]|nr:MgtC/SapB family protein [Burkholderiales bacterium]
MPNALAAQGLETLPQYLTALAIGLLIGLERERNPTAKAGLRTCALVALAGAISAALADAFDAPALIAVGAGAVALMVIAAYYHHHEDIHEQDPGTTTIAAVIVCYLLGALALAGQARLAVILAILATVLLYFKAELGGAARRLERRDLVSILQFAVVAFVVLPLLPDRGYGPFAALNPRHIWLMVVLISGVSLAGYVALRLVGREHGAMLLGLFGGLVSSTATTLAYSRHARGESAFLHISETVIVTANLVLLARLAVVAAIVAPGALAVLAPVLATALVAGAAAEAMGRRGDGKPRELAMPPVGNPTELRAALGFALLYALVLVVAAWLADLWGSKGVYAVALASGLVDVDAITLTNLRLYGLGQLSAAQASTAIAVALLANAAFKLGIVRTAGGRDLFRRCALPIAASVAGAGLGVAVFAWRAAPFSIVSTGGNRAGRWAFAGSILIAACIPWIGNRAREVDL